jgi:hypothetical protein
VLQPEALEQLGISDPFTGAEVGGHSGGCR